MNGYSRRDRKSGDAKVAGLSRSPLLRLPIRSEFFGHGKNQELPLPSASDCAGSGAIAKDQRRRLDEERLAGFNQSADLSTHRRKNSVRTTRATAVETLVPFIQNVEAVAIRVITISTSRLDEVRMITYIGLEAAEDELVPHLVGNIKVGDPYTYCPSVWDYLISRFAVSSALDLGSGLGYAADYLSRKGVSVVAIDGLHANVTNAIFPTVLHDITNGPVVTRVDLVHCQEVVEHISEEYLENLLQSLLVGKIIAMTHAVPGQLGYHHVNLQPSEYWISHLTDRGCVLLEEDTLRIRELAKRDGAVYMVDTGLVFANRKLVARMD